jgi:hypothetical protein
MIASHASMHCVQPMHSIWSPLRMSIPVGHVLTHAPQSTQSPTFAATLASPSTSAMGSAPPTLRPGFVRGSPRSAS